MRAILAATGRQSQNPTPFCRQSVVKGTPRRVIRRGRVWGTNNNGVRGGFLQSCGAGTRGGDHLPPDRGSPVLRAVRRAAVACASDQPTEFRSPPALGSRVAGPQPGAAG